MVNLILKLAWMMLSGSLRSVQEDRGIYAVIHPPEGLVDILVASLAGDIIIGDFMLCCSFRPETHTRQLWRSMIVSSLIYTGLHLHTLTRDTSRRDNTISIATHLWDWSTFRRPRWLESPFEQLLHRSMQATT